MITATEERWSLDPNDRDPGIVHILNDDDPDDEVCVLYGEPEDNARRARLIAESPELLEALKEAVQACGCSLRERDSGHRVGCFAPQANEIIARAEGRA